MRADDADLDEVWHTLNGDLPQVIAALQDVEPRPRCDPNDSESRQNKLITFVGRISESVPENWTDSEIRPTASCATYFGVRP